jgi:hypothetical protein
VIIQWMDSCIPKEEEEELVDRNTRMPGKEIWSGADLVWGRFDLLPEMTIFEKKYIVYSYK